MQFDIDNALYYRLKLSSSLNYSCSFIVSEPVDTYLTNLIQKNFLSLVQNE